ncbi:RRQRL motif-containing zinc-binding protein [Nocardia fluminea]|uniref:RRQRL motif-containing zinc-binding protein n=1 Tax=Nocardia fluminea TaxID=134984 RepID=UPI00364EA2EF
MTTHNEQPDTYPWRAAPSHLMTRRQLRAADLAPGGADPVALMVREATGRKRRRMWAYLFDSRTATPKRTATPAQRRGLTEADLTRTGDPGPAWTTYKEAPMNNDQNHTDARMDYAAADEHARDLEKALNLARRSADRASIDAARSPLLDHLREYRDELESDFRWKPYFPRVDQQGPDPVGRGQRVARLHALVAVNRARHTRAEIDASLSEAGLQGEQALTQAQQATAAAQQRAEDRMAEIPWENEDAVSMMLTDALVWRTASPLAAQRADELIGSYAIEWGVLVDPETSTVSIDPTSTERALERQQFAAAATVWAREQAVVEALAQAPLTPAVKEGVLVVVNQWAGLTSIEPDAMLTHAQRATQRRAPLAHALDTLKLTPADRAVIDFTVDYLRGDTSDLDLLDTPISVDPGIAARGRIVTLLTHYAHKEITAGEVAEEMKVLSPADQELARELGRAIHAQQEADLDQLWPGYVDREKLRERIELYAMSMDGQTADADFLAEEDYEADQVGISDDIGERVTVLATERTQLRALITTGLGFTPIEQAQMKATLDDIDIGVRGEKTVPELLWADERTKSDVDYLRSSAAAVRVKNQLTETVAEQLAQSPARPDEQAQRGVHSAANRLGDTIYTVASGMVDNVKGVNHVREQFMNHRTELGRRLADAGIEVETKGRIRDGINEIAGRAGTVGQAADQRRHAWQSRTEQAVTHRNDSLAQRQAAASSRGTRSPRTGHQSTRDSADKASTPAPARRTPATQRRTATTAEVGR